MRMDERDKHPLRKKKNQFIFARNFLKSVLNERLLRLCIDMFKMSSYVDVAGTGYLLKKLIHCERFFILLLLF